MPVLDDLLVTEVAKGPTQTDWAYAAGFVDGEGCIAVVRSFVAARKRYYYGVHIVVANRDRAVLVIELMTRSRGTLGPYKMPPEWIEEQENLYWIQRKLNHRGNADFVKQAMHSPRRIKREREHAATLGI